MRRTTGTISQVYNGIDINVNARMRNGIQVQAGTTTGQRVTDYCDVRGQLPEQTGGFSTGSEVDAYSPVNPFCHVEPGITTRFTSAGSYVIPKIDVMLSGTFQSSPAEPLQANWTVSSAIVQQTLGRPLAGNAPNVTVNLLAPDQMRGARVNQLDLRVGKVLRFSSQRATVSLDMFNALNADTVLTYNQAFTPGGSVARADHGAHGANGEDHRAVPTSNQVRSTKCKVQRTRGLRPPRFHVRL